MLATTAAALHDRARGGAHIYLSWFAGIGDIQRGAWWPDLEPLAGARHRLRYGLIDAADDTTELTLVTDLGDLPCGARLSFAAAGPRNARAYLPLEAAGAEVIAVDQHDRPALLRHRIGEGAVYRGAYPIEYFGAARPGAHHDDQVWRLYQALAAEAGIRPAVATGDPHVHADQLEHPDGTRYTWLINTAAEPAAVKPATTDGSALIDVHDSTDLTGGFTLAPYAVAVARHLGRTGAQEEQPGGA